MSMSAPRTILIALFVAFGIAADFATVTTIHHVRTETYSATQPTTKT
jgi:hypothetical protein